MPGHAHLERAGRERGRRQARCSVLFKVCHNVSSVHTRVKVCGAMRTRLTGPLGLSHAFAQPYVLGTSKKAIIM